MDSARAAVLIGVLSCATTAFGQTPSVDTAAATILAFVERVTARSPR